MGLWDKLRGELIDIIEWTEPSGSELLAYRFPRYQNEIKYGAKLTVREGQSAAFVNEGQLADVYTPGMYTLETQNMPILSTLKGWKYGFHSPFKAEVYFISTKQWTDLKWGTQNPIMLRDPEFGPVRIRAFGSYAMRVSDPGTFLRQLVATGVPVRALVRTKEARLPDGAQAAVGDLNEPGGLGPALNGVRGVFLLSGYRDMPGLLVRIRTAEVERLVLLSGGAAAASELNNAISRYMIGSEEAVRTSGVGWTILRPYAFMSNALRWVPQLRRGNVVKVPFGARRNP